MFPPWPRGVAGGCTSSLAGQGVPLRAADGAPRLPGSMLPRAWFRQCPQQRARSLASAETRTARSLFETERPEPGDFWLLDPLAGSLQQPGRTGAPRPGPGHPWLGRHCCHFPSMREGRSPTVAHPGLPRSLHLPPSNTFTP